MPTPLFDAANVYLKADASMALRDEDSTTGAINSMIIGGGISLHYTPMARTVPAKIKLEDVELLKFMAVGGLSGEHADGAWWSREDQFNLKAADDGYDAARSMKRSWGRVVKTALDEPLLAPRFPGSSGSKEDWVALAARAVELHNDGLIPGVVAVGAKSRWLDAPIIYPSLAKIREANYEALKKDHEVRAHTHARTTHAPTHAHTSTPHDVGTPSLHTVNSLGYLSPSWSAFVSTL